MKITNTLSLIALLAVNQMVFALDGATPTTSGDIVSESVLPSSVLNSEWNTLKNQDHTAEHATMTKNLQAHTTEISSATVLAIPTASVASDASFDSSLASIVGNVKKLITASSDSSTWAASSSPSSLASASELASSSDTSSTASSAFTASRASASAWSAPPSSSPSVSVVAPAPTISVASSQMVGRPSGSGVSPSTTSMLASSGSSFTASTGKILISVLLTGVLGNLLQ